MRLGRHRDRQRGKALAWTLGTLGSVAAAGASVRWWLARRAEGSSPALGTRSEPSRLERVAESLRAVERRAEDRARDLGTHARDTARGLGGRAVATADELRTRAPELAAAARARALELATAARERFGRDRAVRLDPTTLWRVSGGLLVWRAVFGRGLGRFPAGIIGATILRRARSLAARVGGAAPEAVGREAETADEEASGAETFRDEPSGDVTLGDVHELDVSGRDRAGTSGGARREPEVREVKSPAELEPGIAHATPEPTYENRADRPDLRSRKSRRPSEDHDVGRGGAGVEASDEEEEDDHVAGRSGFVAPPRGAAVREDDLGVVMPPDDLGEADDGAPRAAPRDADAPRGDPHDR